MAAPPILPVLPSLAHPSPCSYACDKAIEHAEEHPHDALQLWQFLSKEIGCGVPAWGAELCVYCSLRCERAVLTAHNLWWCCCACPRRTSSASLPLLFSLFFFFFLP